MDAVGFTKAAVWGMSEGGPAACMFAATRPERTAALLLYSTFAYLWFNGWEDIDVTRPTCGRARLPSSVSAIRPQRSSSATSSK